MKVYIGAPGSAKAAGQGYVNITQLQEYALDAQKNYSTFGGVMLWDASDAYFLFRARCAQTGGWQGFVSCLETLDMGWLLRWITAECLWITLKCRPSFVLRTD